MGQCTNGTLELMTEVKTDPVHVQREEPPVMFNM